MRKPAGSEGIYFVIRLPGAWELVAFRFDEHPEGGHSEFWEAHVTPMLAKAWGPLLFPGSTAAARTRSEHRLKAELDLHYDGFPRARVTWKSEDHRFAIYHGANLKPGMKLPRRTIEQAFGLTGVVDWDFDEHEQCSALSVDGIQNALRLKERWATFTPDFD